MLEWLREMSNQPESRPARAIKPTVIVAPTAFKGSLTPVQAARAIARGLGLPCVRVPVADGGDGTLDALHEALGGRIEKVGVTGPLGRPVTARILWMGRDAFIEMADACGLRLVPESRRNPMITTSRGLGELILAARRARTIYVGIGGSATNDAGAGMLQALGARILDADGRPIGPGGAGLETAVFFDGSALPKLRLVVLSDVENPLLGPHGATRTFGPQKGATPDMVERLERAVAHFARLAGLRNVRGAGAAGGVGAALQSLLHAPMRSGAKLILELVGFRSLRGDAVVTGEGQVDETTLQGKIVQKVIQASRAPVYVICGAARVSARRLGVEHIEVLPRRPFREAAQWLEKSARRVGALIKARSGGSR